MLLTTGIISCNGQSKENLRPPNTKNQSLINENKNVKIYLNKKGTISVNGEVKNLKELDSILKKLKEDHGIVYYSRSLKYKGELWMNILDLVSKYELPIALFTDKSFTKRIGN